MSKYRCTKYNAQFEVLTLNIDFQHRQRMPRYLLKNLLCVSGSFTHDMPSLPSNSFRSFWPLPSRTNSVFSRSPKYPTSTTILFSLSTTAFIHRTFSVLSSLTCRIASLGCPECSQPPEVRSSVTTPNSKHHRR